LRFQVVDVSSFEHWIQRLRILEIIISFDDRIKYTKTEKNSWRRCLNSQFSRNFDFDFFIHDHSSKNWISVDQTNFKIMSLIYYLQKSDITLIISFDDEKEQTFNDSAINMTSLLILRFSDLTFSIAYQSDFASNLQFKFLNSTQNNCIVTRFDVFVDSKNEIF
jgi:hypothetical protein